MAILDGFIPVPDLIVSCQRARLIYILQLESTVSALVCMMRFTLDGTLLPGTALWQSGLDRSDEHTPLWSRWVLCLLYGQFHRQWREIILCTPQE